MVELAASPPLEVNTIPVVQLKVSMPDFPKSLPRPNKFKCDVNRHLWRRGLALAIYQKAGGITKGGVSGYFGDTALMAEFLGANKTVVRRMFALLHRAGWLVVVPNEDSRKAVKKTQAKKTRRWVSHEEWAKSHPGECVNVEESLMPWSADADPFVGQLWAAMEGKLRMYESLIIHARTCGRPDTEIVAAISEAWKVRNAKKARGEYQGTGARTVFFDTIKALKESSQR
jgi:hypothetical protein